VRMEVESGGSVHRSVQCWPALETGEKDVPAVWQGYLRGVQ
jgi:hypothetical protein